jgi:predicted short-subunit dehydrogenase-like oxidoreductase (DUF2520 family)
MKTRKKLRIALAGSGNVATHLARAIYASEHQLVQILSRNTQEARALANRYGAEAIDNAQTLDPALDILILALSDDALHTDYISNFPEQITICHTSGSVSMEVLKQYPRHGIFYPLQTFSKQKEVDFSEIPICLEANNPEVLQTLEQLAKNLSSRVYFLNSGQRKSLHLAAVFACNFTNLMYRIAEDLIGESDMDFDILRPLITETAAKVQEHLPGEVQTGPAARNDLKIINEHLKALEKHKDYKEIYQLLTEVIVRKRYI